MSNLSSLKIRLSEVLKRSETRNLTEIQRERALNDALLFDVGNFKPWPFLVDNSTTQAVDGVVNLPGDFRKEYALHYGTSPTSNWEKYTFIDHVKFQEDINDTATVTESDGLQMMKIYPTDDQGDDQGNETADTDLGLNSATGQARIFQTFTPDETTLKGVMVKLKTVGTPTGTLTLGLYATAAGLPSGSALDTVTLRVADINSQYENFFFDLNYTLTLATEYAIVLSTSESVDASNYISWQYSGTSQIADGSRGVYDSVGATYATAVGDMWFKTYSEVYTLNFGRKLREMVNASDLTGLTSDFDEAIVMLAAARLMSRQAGGQDGVKISLANELRYGSGGNKVNPTDDSAYGKLNILWHEYRIPSERPQRRMINVFENRNTRGGRNNRDLSYLERIR